MKKTFAVIIAVGCFCIVIGKVNNLKATVVASQQAAATTSNQLAALERTYTSNSLQVNASFWQVTQFALASTTNMVVEREQIRELQSLVATLVRQQATKK